MEEKNHAALLKGADRALFSTGEFPYEMLQDEIKEAIRLNTKLDQMKEDLKKDPPSREEAFRLGLAIEGSLIEAHYQDMMSDKFPSEIIQIFQQLNSADKNHVQRMQDYADSNSIVLDR